MTERKVKYSAIERASAIGIIVLMVIAIGFSLMFIFTPRPPPEPAITVKYFGDYGEQLTVGTTQVFEGTPLTIHLINLDNNSCYFFFIPGMENESSVKIEYKKEQVVTLQATSVNWLLLRDDGHLILALYINPMRARG